MNLSNFNAQQLSAYLKGAADKIAEDSTKREEFQPLFIGALEDDRATIWQSALHYYPLPQKGDVPQVIDKDLQRAEFLLAHLPGLYRANSTAIKRSIKIEAFKAKTGENATIEDVYEEFQRGAKAALIADKFWLRALTYPNPDIRKAAVKIIPPSGNTLSLVLPWMTGDSDVRVRREAKRIMGIECRDRSIYRHGGNASELVIKAALGTVTEPQLDGMLADSRSSVRYAAALRLDASSERWAYLSRDPSPRLRRLAAERLALDAPELKVLAEDVSASVASVAAKRLRPRGADGKRKYWWSEDEEEKK